MTNMMSVDIAPNQTIYVSNVYERLKKEETKKALLAVFSQFGKVKYKKKKKKKEEEEEEEEEEEFS